MLDAGCKATQGMWYLLAAENNGPCPRVGHASMVLKHRYQNGGDEDETQDTKRGKQNRLILVGGATPAGPFNDVYLLTLRKFI